MQQQDNSPKCPKCSEELDIKLIAEGKEVSQYEYEGVHYYISKADLENWECTDCYNG